jgi:hypothetical protein
MWSNLFILIGGLTFGLICALGWGWRHRVVEPLQPLQWLKSFAQAVGWVLAVLGIGLLFYFIVHADEYLSPREQLADAVVGVLVLAVEGYRGLRKRLDGILHELREIRTPGEGKERVSEPWTPGVQYVDSDLIRRETRSD